MHRLTLCALTLLLSAATWAAAEDEFKSGVTAAKGEDFELALRHFRKAHEAGLRSAVLLYNLGVTHYKLGQYARAKPYFAELVDDSKWGGLAEYNLGLLSERMGQDTLARRHYERSAAKASSNKLKQLAQAKLGAQPARVSSPDDWIAHTSIAVGHDDNVLLADDGLLASVSDESDSFIEAIAAGSLYVSGDYADGWRLDLTGYYRGYSDLDDYDFASAAAGVVYNRLLGGWHLQSGVKADAQFSGGEAFTSGGTFRVRGYHKLGDFGLRLTNDFSFIDGASDFDYLTGTRNATAVEIIRASAQTRFRLGYRFTINDRDDLRLVDEFYSYSPTRQEVFVALEQEMSERVSAEVRLTHRDSEYDDDNVELDADGNALTRLRDEDRLTGNVRVAWRFSDDWRLFGEYRYTDNESNFNRYTYDASVYQLGIELAP